MRYFAQITDGIVARVIVATDAAWCTEHLGGTWVETFLDGLFRGKYAAIGDTYDAVADKFLPQDEEET